MKTNRCATRLQNHCSPKLSTLHACLTFKAGTLLSPHYNAPDLIEPTHSLPSTTSCSQQSLLRIFRFSITYSRKSCSGAQYWATTGKRASIVRRVYLNILSCVTRDCESSSLPLRIYIYRYTHDTRAGNARKRRWRIVTAIRKGALWHLD